MSLKMCCNKNTTPVRRLTKRSNGRPPEDLLDKCRDVDQRCSIVDCWKPIPAYDAVDLRLSAFLDLTVDRHEIKE